MPEEKVTLVIFEGGQARTELDELLIAIRKAVTLDTMTKALAAPGLDQVLLCTNYRDLAREAAELGVLVDFSLEPFHFGRRLAGIIVKYGLEKVIYMGGVSAPLLQPEDLTSMAQTLREQKHVVLVNNVQSADLVAFTPAQMALQIPPPENDNSLGYLLREAGLTRLLIPNSPRINFDLDTPTDMMILALQPDCGPRAGALLRNLDWDYSRLKRAREVLKQTAAEVVIAGRVGAPIMTYINSNFPLRLRVYSEERGMKALGREERGEVVSLLGFHLDRVGPAGFFADLAQLAQAVFLDSRVLFAHWKKAVSEWDRFHSDLGRYDVIRDEKVREFTRAAVSAKMPVVLGGHSLVSGGLWLLAESVVREREVRLS